jgi:hypothetical protein
LGHVGGIYPWVGGDVWGAFSSHDHAGSRRVGSHRNNKGRMIMKNSLLAMVLGLSLAFMVGVNVHSARAICENYTDITGDSYSHKLINFTGSNSIMWVNSTANIFCNDDNKCYDNATLVAYDVDESFIDNNGTDYGSLCDKKILWYHFEDLGNESVYDACENHDKTLTGGLGYEDGIFGRGINFVGDTNKYIDVGNLVGTLDELSVSFWARPANTYNNDSSGYGYRLFRWETQGADWMFCGADELYCASNGGGFWVTVNSTQVISTTKTFMVNRWYFFVVTFSYLDNSTKLYIDGTLEGESAALHQFSTDGLVIGTRGSSWNSYNGSFDELIIWNYSLSENEVKSLYNFSFLIGETHINITPQIPIPEEQLSYSYCRDNITLLVRDYGYADNGSAVLSDRYLYCRYGCLNSTITALGAPGCKESNFVLMLMLIIAVVLMVALIRWVAT